VSAPDFVTRAREAGERGESWSRFTSDVCEEVAAFDAAGNPRTEVDEMQAAWREGRQAHRIANGWLVRWTTASEDYDQFGTETVEHCDGDYHGKKLRKVLLCPDYADYQAGRYGSGLHGCWDEDPREQERRWAEERAREKAEREEREARRKAGLEWLATAPDELVDGDEDAFDEELRARGLRWEDGRDERRNRKARREAEARAVTWAHCRALVPDGATLIDKGSDGYRGFYGWVPGRQPQAWRNIEIRPSYECADDADKARVVSRDGFAIGPEDYAGSLLVVAEAIEKGEMRIAGPDEHVPPRAVVQRIGKSFTEILRVELGGKVAWVGEPTFGDPLVLDDSGRIVRTKALREAAEKAWRAKRFGGAP
jgi:hypothetical protein